MTRLVEKLKKEIIEDHERNNKKDGVFSLKDRYLSDVDVNSYNQAIKELNADSSFSYTAKIIQFQGLLKIRYQPHNTVLFKKVDMNQVINHLEELIDILQQFENKREGNTAYLKIKNDKNKEEIQVVIENINSKEVMRINTTNEL